MTYFDAGPDGAVVAIPFQIADVAISQTNLDMTALQGTLQVMPWSGSIVGLSIRANAAITAGSLTAKVHRNGTEFALPESPVIVLNSSSQSGYWGLPHGQVGFQAGDGLGVSVTTTGDYAPVTADYDALLWVRLDPP